MKKFTILFFLLTVVCLTNSISAQFRAGLIGGVNFADMKANSEIKGRTLFGIGGTIQYSFNDHISILAEPMYLRKGGISIEEIGNPEIKINMDFMQLPIYLKYSFPVDKNFKPYIIAGPSIGYRLTSELESEIYGITFNADLKSLTKAIDFEFAFGSGFEIPLETITLFIEGTYTWGLTDIHKNGIFKATGGGVSFDEELNDESDIKTRGLQILMGISFPL